jgi:hypothetical protein
MVIDETSPQAQVIDLLYLAQNLPQLSRLLKSPFSCCSVR